MLSRLSTLLYLFAGVAVTAVAWATLVPGSVSATTFGGIFAVAIGLWGASTIALRAIRPDPSVAQLLYDTEHPAVGAVQRRRD